MTKHEFCAEGAERLESQDLGVSREALRLRAGYENGERVQTEIALIWAQARDADGRPVIGAKGDIPWHVPEDFAHFKALTSGHPVIMGQATWESLPLRPLPGRTNVVLSLDPAYVPVGARRGEQLDVGFVRGLDTRAERATRPTEGVVVTGSVDEAIAAASSSPGGEIVWVIGGGQVYRLFMELGLADRLEVTEIDVVVDGDTFAPTIEDVSWRSEEAAAWASSSKGLNYRFRTYRRR